MFAFKAGTFPRESSYLLSNEAVFERVFCADGALCSRCRPRSSAPLELGKSASTRPLLHEARISRGDMCMHMWAPRGRLMSVCAWICCAAYLSFLVFCSPSSVDTVVAMPASLCSRELFRVQSSEELF